MLEKQNKKVKQNLQQQQRKLLTKAIYSLGFDEVINWLVIAVQAKCQATQWIMNRIFFLLLFSHWVVQFFMPFIFNFLNFSAHYKLSSTTTRLPLSFAPFLIIFLEQRIGVNGNRSIISN